MGLHCVLAHKKLPRDLAVAHALRDQFEDLKLPSRDAQVLSFSLVWEEPFATRDRHFLHNHLPSPSRQLEAEPDSENRKDRRDQSAVYFHRMLDDQEAILR